MPLFRGLNRRRLLNADCGNWWMYQATRRRSSLHIRAILNFGARRYPSGDQSLADGYIGLTVRFRCSPWKLAIG